jgi:3-hydroxyisobutyrate dehydrogenase-like beta-hydroxyacid dehydrogenase
MTTTVAILGTGKMGAAMARRLEGVGVCPDALESHARQG